MGTIASSNSQREREREREREKTFPMPSCLHRYKFLQCSLFLFFYEPSSFFLLHKSPQSSQNSSSASFSVSLTETIMVFFLGQKLLQSITLSLCNGCSFLLLFLFFFWSKKNSQKLSLPKRNFCLKLSRTLMWVQCLIECYRWSFNNGDLVLWVCNVFIFYFLKSFDLNCQNRSRFTEPGGRIAIRTGPSFFGMEWFLMLNGP